MTTVIHQQLALRARQENTALKRRPRALLAWQARQIPTLIHRQIAKRARQENTALKRKPRALNAWQAGMIMTLIHPHHARLAMMGISATRDILAWSACLAFLET
jgi:BMFP domain-containing protein YqiC